MRSSDLFTAIAEKSRPTATTHSRDRERNPAEPSSECEPDPRADAAPRPRRPPVGSRRSFRGSSVRSRHAGPTTSTVYPYWRRRGFALSPGTAYRDPTRRPTPSPGAGSGLIREFEGADMRIPAIANVIHAPRDSRSYHGHTPKSAIRSIVVLVVRGHVDVRGDRGPRWAWLPRGHAQFAESAAASVIYSISNVIQYKFRLHRVHARASCDSHRGDPGLNHTSRFEDRPTPQRHHRFAH